MEKQKITEERIQYEIVSWFTNNYCLKNHTPRCCIFSVPNDTKDVRELMRKRATGLMAGVSDLVVLLSDGVTLFIEVKTSSGIQSEKQKNFQLTVAALGFEYYIVKNFADFEKIIKTKTK